MECFLKFIGSFVWGFLWPRKNKVRARGDLMMNYGLSPVGSYLMLALIAVDPARAQGYLDDLRDDIMETVEYNPDGSIKKITFRTAGIASSEAPTCPKCGKKATWVEQYKRWYCYDCKDYL